MILKNVLYLTLGLLGLLLTVGVLIFAVIGLLQYSPERLKIVIESLASEALDRELQIGELLEVDFGWDTYLLAHDVRLANPDWAGSPDFVRAGRLLIRINLPSIWRDGPILINQLELDDASVSLLAPAEHAPNWDFWPDEKKDEPEPESELVEIIDSVFPVLIREGAVASGRVTFKDPDQDIEFLIEDLAIQEDESDALVNLNLKGTINEIPLRVSGGIGPTSALLTKKNVKLDLSVRWGNLSVDGRGTIADLTAMTGPNMHLMVEAPHSRPLLDLLGLKRIEDGPLRFEGHLTDAQPGLALNAQGMFDNMDLEVSGKLENPLTFDGLDLSFTAGGKSLAGTGSMLGIAVLPDVPYHVTGEIFREGTLVGVRGGKIIAGEGRIEIDGRLPNFPEIDGWELNLEGRQFNLSILGSLLGIAQLPANPYDIAASLGSTEKGVEIADLHVSNEKSKLQVDGVVGEAPEYHGTRMQVNFSGKDLGFMAPWLGARELPNEAFQLSGGVSLNESGWQVTDGLFDVAGLRLGLEGEIDQLPDPGQLSAALSLEAADLASTLKAFGLAQEGLPAFPIKVSAYVEGPPDQLKLREAAVVSGDSSLSVSGLLGDPVKLTELDLAVSFKTPDLLTLLPPGERDPLPSLPLDASGNLVLSADVIALSAVEGTFGGAHILLDGQISIDEPRENSHLLLKADGPDLRTILGPWTQGDTPSAPFTVAVDASLTSGRAHIEELKITIADQRLVAWGDIADLDNLTDTRGEIEFSGPSSRNLFKLFNSETSVPDSAYTMNAVIRRDPDWLRLDPISLVWGQSDYGGSINVRLGDVPTVQADLYSKYVSLPFLLPNLQELEQTQAAQPQQQDEAAELLLPDKLSNEELAERVISDTPLDFDWLRTFNGSIKYRIDEVFIKEDSSGTLAVDITVQNGVLSSKELSWGGTFIRGSGDITLEALDKGAAVELDLNLNRLPLLLMMGGEPEYDPNAFYRAKLSTRGRSFRDMAKNSNGAVVFKGGGGRIDNKGLDLILGDVLEEILSRVNPFSEKDAYTRVICHAGAFNIKDGKVSVNPGFVLRSDKMDTASGGTVNLHNEKLDLTFNTRSRKGIGISAGKAITPYFKIGGTMANTRMTLDPKGVAVSGGVAVATAGLSILAEGLWDRWVATAKNPCNGLILRISEEKNSVYQPLL